MTDKDRMKALSGVMGTLIVGVIAWGIGINARISVLEFQVRVNQEAYQEQMAKNDRQMKELIDKVSDIQMKVTELSVKQEDRQ